MVLPQRWVALVRRTSEDFSVHGLLPARAPPSQAPVPVRTLIFLPRNAFLLSCNLMNLVGPRPSSENISVLLGNTKCTLTGVTSVGVFVFVFLLSSSSSYYFASNTVLYFNLFSYATVLLTPC